MMRNLRHTAEIRQVFQYNNNHYTTLAHIVTTLSGMPFVEYSTTHILEPVGLSRSTYNWTTARERGMTDGFAHLGINMTACREKSPDVHHTHPSCTGRAINTGWHMAGNGMNEAGAGGVVSCGKDMVSS
jgi:CubicO group peptidase (beta-lactamase class C family)